ncbi:hypothetical protein ACFFRR_009799 [Megaselia abdita]
MSETQEPTTCKICANIIFMDQDTIHFDCIKCNNRNKSTTTICTATQPLSSTSIPPETTNSSNANFSDETAEACGITVVPPPKSIFLSRLGIEVSNEQVKHFIKTKIPDSTDFTVRRCCLEAQENSLHSRLPFGMI